MKDNFYIKVLMKVKKEGIVKVKNIVYNYMYLFWEYVIMFEKILFFNKLR